MGTVKYVNYILSRELRPLPPPAMSVLGMTLNCI